MNKIKILVLSFLLTLTAFSLNAQNQNDMRLNEFMVVNTEGMVDEFGERGGWIELVNTSYSTVNIAGCHFTNTLIPGENKKTYVIPQGDNKTMIGPRQYVVFWADNQSLKGTFHLNFSLEESDSLYFIASDGRTIIDFINVPKDLEPNQTFGRHEHTLDFHVRHFFTKNVDSLYCNDGSGLGWGIREYASPSFKNSNEIEESKSQKMKRTDPNGWILTLTAMSVVFLALILLCFIFKFTGYLSIRKLNKNTDKSRSSKGQTPIKCSDTPADTYAAIAMALHLYFEDSEAHDEESLTITLTHTNKTYSPWSSKIYGLRQTPEMKKK